MPRRKVILVNPPSPPGVVVNREGVCGLGTTYRGDKGFLYPPHTLASVAGQLRRMGHHVMVVDAVTDGGDSASLVKWIKARRPEVVGVHLSYAALDWDIAATNFIAQRCQEARVVLFGPALGFAAEAAQAQTLADAILVGEPEFLLPKVVDSLSEESGYRQPRVYCVAKELGTGDGLADDLDGLAPPAWDICRARDGRVSVMASRGCDEGCAYCPYVLAQGNRLRARSPESVVEEIGLDVDKWGARRVIFRDPVFAADRQRVVSLCELILRRGLRFVWECESRPEHFDPGLLGLLRRAGCDEVKVGFETVDGELLANLGRLGNKEEAPAYLESCRHLAEACRITGLRLRLFIMAGLPGQSQSSVEETRAFVEDLRPHAVNVKYFERYPGLRTDGAASGPP